MSALGDARVVLAEVPAITHSADRLKMALAALVAEIEAAPVVDIFKYRGSIVIEPDDDSVVGKRVRLVGVE